MVRTRNSNGSAPRRDESQQGHRPAPLPPRPQRRGLRAFARASTPSRRNGSRPADENRNDARPRRNARRSSRRHGRNRRARHAHPHPRPISAANSRAPASRALRPPRRIRRIQTRRRANGLQARRSRPARPLLLPRLRTRRIRPALAQTLFETEKLHTETTPQLLTAVLPFRNAGVPPALLWFSGTGTPACAPTNTKFPVHAT